MSKSMFPKGIKVSESAHFKTLCSPKISNQTQTPNKLEYFLPNSKTPKKTLKIPSKLDKTDFQNKRNYNDENNNISNLINDKKKEINSKKTEIKFSNDKINQIIQLYDQANMRTKTLPENFNIENFEELEKLLTIHKSNKVKSFEKKIEKNDINRKMPKNFSEIPKFKNFHENENKEKENRILKENKENKIMNQKYETLKINNYFHENKDIHLRHKENIINFFKMNQGKREISNFTLIPKENLNEIHLNLINYSKINDHINFITNYNEIKKKYKLDPNYKGSNDWTSLHYSSLNGNKMLLNFLLLKGADIDALTSSKLTPLIIAAQKGHCEILECLINAGAELNRVDLTGNTALHYCVKNNHKKIVQILLNKPSILINIKNKNDKTPSELCIDKEILLLFDNFIKKITADIKKRIQIHNVKSETAAYFFKNNENISENNVSYSTTANNFSNNDEENDDNSNEKISLNHFHIHGLIGKGSFGEVYLVEKKNTKKLYALKVLHKSKIIGNNLIKYALTERNVLSLTNHPFIVKLIYAFQTDEELFLIMEYCPGGDLSQLLKREKTFSEEKTRLYLAEIILGLEDLHKRDIIFRDLKPDNIVIDEDGHCLLTDFGLSKEGVLDPNQGAKSFCGSFAYLAPEMLKRNGHGKAVDWYLLGVVAYEMLVGSPPYFTTNRDELFSNIEKANLKIPAELSSEVKSLLKELLQRNPSKRLGSGKYDAEEIKNHPFFKNIKWNDVAQRKLKLPKPIFKKRIDQNVKINVDLLQNNLLNTPKNYVKGWSFIANC